MKKAIVQVGHGEDSHGRFVRSLFRGKEMYAKNRYRLMSVLLYFRALVWRNCSGYFPTVPNEKMPCKNEDFMKNLKQNIKFLEEFVISATEAFKLFLTLLKLQKCIFILWKCVSRVRKPRSHSRFPLRFCRTARAGNCLWNTSGLLGTALLCRSMYRNSGR